MIIICTSLSRSCFAPITAGASMKDTIPRGGVIVRGETGEGKDSTDSKAETLKIKSFCLENTNRFIYIVEVVLILKKHLLKMDSSGIGACRRGTTPIYK